MTPTPPQVAPTSTPVLNHNAIRRGGVAAAWKAPAPREPALTFTADEALLFRFSALTYNAHRIHYDHNWVREEGYGDLIVHGPLQALMMGELVRRRGDGLVGKQFAYRLVAPMIGPQTFTVLAGEDGVNAGAEVRDVHGVVTADSTVDATAPRNVRKVFKPELTIREANPSRLL